MEFNPNHGDKTPEISTIWYRAPELICNADYSYPIDIWSLGCVFGELYSGTPLFPYDSELFLINKQAQMVGASPKLSFPVIQLRNETSLSEQFSKYGADVYSLLEGMIKFDPSERYSITQCLSSDYFGNPYITESEILYENYLDLWKPKYNYDNYRKNSIVFKLRKILLPWFLEICDYFHTTISTYYTTIMFLDYFTIKSELKITTKNYQLIGIGCLLIASKLESYSPFGIEDLLDLSDDQYTKDELLEMEKQILRELEFDLIFPTIFNYYSLYVRKEDKKLEHHLLIFTLQPDYLKYNFGELTEACFDIENSKIDDIENSKINKWINEYYQKPIDIIERRLL